MDIYVGNIPFDTTEQDLQALFSPHGTVAKVKIVEDFNTGQPRGFAFVTMEDWKEAQNAIKELDGHEVGGRPMKVNQAREREQRPSGGGGGGFGGGGNRGGSRGGPGGGGGNRGGGNRW